jgi:hypothetical protein
MAVIRSLVPPLGWEGDERLLLEKVVEKERPAFLPAVRARRPSSDCLRCYLPCMHLPAATDYGCPLMVAGVVALPFRDARGEAHGR